MKKQQSSHPRKVEAEASAISLKRASFSLSSNQEEVEELPRRSVDDSDNMVKGVY